MQRTWRSWFGIQLQPHGSRFLQARRGGPRSGDGAKLSTNAFLIERLTTTVNAKTIMLETPIPLPNGFTVYMTGTLILLL
jgi:hypothetical protein